MGRSLQLKYLSEFKRILADYKIDPASLELLAKIKLVLLAAPSSTGRNTIIRELLKQDGYHYLVSDTTRPPRINDGVKEKNGTVYWFRTEADMLADLQAGKYLEAAIIHDQQVSGISIKELARVRDEGKIAITDIEIAGVRTILQAKSDALAIFMLPPSFDEWQRRLAQRGKMNVAETRRRLESAITELSAALNEPHYVFVINHTVAETTAVIKKLTSSDQPDIRDSDLGRQLAEQLLEETRIHLAG